MAEFRSEPALPFRSSRREEAHFSSEENQSLTSAATSEFDRLLAQDRWADPLALSMAALVAHDNQDELAGLRCTRPDLAFVLARKELERVERFARDAGDENQQHLLRHLAACATLQRSLTARQLLPAIEKELAALHRSWPKGAGDLAGQLCKALPGADGGVADIEPDFIGEAVVLDGLRARLPKDTPTDRVPLRLAEWRDTVARCARRHPRAVCATLVHAFQNFGQLPDYGPGLLAAVDRLLETGRLEQEPQLLLALEAAMPHQTVGLRTHAAEVTRALYERLKAAMREARNELKPEVARLANNLGVRLSELGRRAEALATAQEAVELYRALARQNPDAFQPDLAMSLGALSQVLAAMERHAEAVAVLGEGIRTLQPQFTQLPEAFARLRAGLVRDYLESSQAAGAEPD